MRIPAAFSKFPIFLIHQPAHSLQVAQYSASHVILSVSVVLVAFVRLDRFRLFQALDRFRLLRDTSQA
jgi:hypothetical protein